MKKNLILVILMSTIFLEIFCQEKSEDMYIQNPRNEKFEGTYILEDGQQSFMLTLTSRSRVRMQENIDIFVDLLEGNISYSKSGKTILSKDVKPHITYGMAQKDNPNTMTASFLDRQHEQTGIITLTLHPQNNTAIFKLEKSKSEIVNIITNEADRQRVELEQQKRMRPFVIPDSLVLKKRR